MTRHDKTQKRSKKHIIHAYSPDKSDFGAKRLEHELAEEGLYIKDVSGDGNCLFRSFSDQLGRDEDHAQIRYDVVEYLRLHQADFEHFVEEDYTTYLDRMGNDGVYGDNLEIVAFARAYNRPVKVYQPGMAYVIQPETKDAKHDSLVHLAYFSWEHYASIRNSKGPHNGEPCVEPTKTPIDRPKQVDHGQASPLEKICLASVPGSGLERIRELLKHHRGNVNLVVDTLLEEAVHDAYYSEIDTPKIEPIAEAPIRVDTRAIAMPPKTASSSQKLTARDKKDRAKRQQKEAARLRRREAKAGTTVVQEAESSIKILYI